MNEQFGQSGENISIFLLKCFECDFLAISEDGVEGSHLVERWRPTVERGGVLNEQVWRF
jgi:hypothetical protein